MRTLVVSDLHLGAAAEHDLLRSSEARRALLPEVERADQLVLLGDVLELRGIPAHAVLERARPALAEIGEAARDARVVLVPGNHDHQLAAEWLERRRRRRSPSVGIAEEWRPARSDLAAAVTRALGAPGALLAYPGVWIRPDVYATHGHYLDCHNSVPALEVLAAAGMARARGGLAERSLSPDAYERILSPLYAFTYQLAQGARDSRRRPTAGLSLRLWQRLNPHDGRSHPSAGERGRLALSRFALGGVLIPAAVAGINRAGLGPFSAELSPAAIRRAALRGMVEAVARLGVEARHVIFGHTHRAGPLPGDDHGEGWAVEGRPRLWNSGSWVFEPTLIGPRGRGSGHWPGACVVVNEDGPPTLKRMAVEPGVAAALR